MASAQVVKTSVIANSSPSQDSNHPDHLFPARLLLGETRLLKIMLADARLKQFNGLSTDLLT